MGRISAVAGAALLCTVLAQRTPPPRSEAREREMVRVLAGDIGLRVAGTPGAEKAAAYLAAELRKIPGVEVEVQDDDAVEPTPISPLQSYRVRNVLGRLRGRSTDAVLLAAHYDSPPESVGAGDNAMGVAAAVGVLRALAAGPPLRNSVILCLDGGEEAAMLGASAFLRHDWAPTVRAFVNVEGGDEGPSLPGGGPAWMMRRYARSAPHPAGTSLLQDLLGAAAGVGGDNTAVYRRLAPGMTVGPLGDKYAYHTRLDRPERLRPGTLQHLGDNLLGFTRDLAGGVRGEEAPGVFFDVAGRVMVAYGPTTAKLLAAAALALALLALRRSRLSWRDILGGTLAMSAATAAALAASVAGGLLLSQRPGRWFAQPAPGILTFAALATLGALAVHRAWRRRSEARAWAGSIVIAGVLLGVLSGTGSSYLPLSWVASASLALLASPRRRWAIPLALFPALLLTLQPAWLLLQIVIPLTQLYPPPVSHDVVVALLVALPVALLLLLLAPSLPRPGGIALAAAVVAAAGLAVTALQPPFSVERPQRIDLMQQGRQLTMFTADDAPRTLPAGPSGLAPPSLRVEESRPEEDGTRSVRLRLDAGAYQEVRLALPRSALVGWSLPAALPRGEEAHIDFLAIPPEGREVTLRLRGPAELRATAVHDPASTAALDGARARLPRWTAVHAWAKEETRLSL